MELYGSLLNISGSVTASTFTGSFIGDGSGLTGIQASGVVGLNLSQIATGSFTASLSPDGFNVNTNTSITGAVNITGSISLNGEPIGTGKLNETTFQAYTSSNDGRVAALETSSGSLNSFTSSINTTIKSKLDNDGVISGSVQVNITGTTGYSTFSSSISSSAGILSSSIATTDLNQNNRLDTIEGNYATTGSNTFKGTQTHSGSIIPSVDNQYDLGSVTHQWRDVYISSGSLYIDGTKVISSTAQELQITTDNGQSIKILEGGTDSIILQTADGNVELKSNADGDILLDPTNGKIVLKGTIEVLNGQKIQSSVGGTPIVFANDIVVSGSIDITGTIDGIDLTSFSSSVNTRVSNLESGAGSLNAFTASATTRLNSLETTTGSLNSYTSSNNTRLGVIETATSSLNSFTSSINTTIKNNLNDEDVISGSIQVNIGETTGYAGFSSSIAITDLSQTNRLNSIEGKSGSYATTGSNVFIGDQTITGSLFISQNLIVQGSSSLENITASAVSIGTNTIILNTDTPAFRYAGISVFDSGSTNVTASLFYDSLSNQWKFKHTDVGTSDASIMLFGPLGNDIDNAPLLDGNFLTKVENNGHGHHITTSSIFDNGSKVSINSNTEITGTFVATGTALVSGSAQVLNGTGIFSGSAQLPSGLVSGSSQVLAGTTIHSGSFFNGISVVSGSGQISFGGITDKPALVSGSAQISFGGITDKPALVSGSSQISFNSISDRPALVSGSAQIDLTATTNYSTGIKTRLNAEGVISGSSQVTGIGNPQLVNPSFHVGTTSISLGRTSASQTLTGVAIDGNAGSATILETARTIGGVSFNGSANIDLPGVNTSGNQNTSGNAATATEVSRTVGAGSEANLLSATIAENDYFRLRVGGGSNAGFVEIATGDDGTEPIHVRQYTGVFSTLTRTATLLDGSGNTSFPGTVTAPTFSGALSGNASTVTNGVYTTGDQSIGGAKTFTETLKVLKSGRTLTIGQDYANHINWDSNVDLALNISNGGTGGIVFFGGGSSSKFSVTAAGVGAFAGNLSAANLSGTNTGDQTNISGTAGSETLSTVTGRGASTSTAISINNTLTVTSGRVIARTGGANTYGIFSGYDNNNHMMSFRAAIAGSTTTPTITAGHQTTFIEYAEANETTGWFFKSASTGTYEEIAKITRIGITPGSNGTQNLGSASLRWNTVFTSDLSLSNGIGDYTIVEGENDLFLYNNKQNKVYKFMLQEVNPNDATPKRPE